MKKILIVLVIIFGIVTPIYAAGASIVGTNTLVEGKAGYVSIKTQSPSTIEGTIKNTNPDVIEIKNTDSSYRGNPSDKTMGSFVLNNDEKLVINAKKPGKAILNFSGVATPDGDGPDVNLNSSITITVTEIPKNNVTPPTLDNTEGEKAGTTLTPEQKAKAEAERKEKELEALRLIPLVEKMSVTSASDRMKDQLIDTVKFVDQQFEYSITLPRKIDSVTLDIPTPEGVTLDYPKEVVIPEGETSKVIEVKAFKGEVNQVIKVTINKDVTPIINRENGGVTYEVYEEKKVEELFETYNFESIKDEKIGTYYSNEKVTFQMLTKDDNEVNFFMLDETQELIEKVTVMTKENGDLFFIDLENDRENQINGNSRKTLPFDKLISFTEIDNSLVVQDEILAWDLEEGVVVEGTTTDNLKSKFMISDTLDTVQVIVPQVEKVGIDPLTIGLGAALVALAGTNFVYLLTKFIRKRKYNM